MAQITEDEARLIRASFGKLLPLRDDFSIALYNRLFDVAPAARALFPKDMHMQREKLIATLAIVVKGASSLESMSEELRALGKRHTEYGAEAAHYDVLGQVLIDTLAEFLGDEFDDATRNAWLKLYGEISAMMLS